MLNACASEMQLSFPTDLTVAVAVPHIIMPSAGVPISIRMNHGTPALPSILLATSTVTECTVLESFWA